MPSLTPRRRATPPERSPSRQQRTNAARYFSGSAWTSSSRTAWTSCQAAFQAGSPGRTVFVCASRPPPLRLLSCSHGHSKGNPVKPTAQRLPLADRPGVAGQDEEGGLEGIFRVLLLPQHPAADSRTSGPYRSTSPAKAAWSLRAEKAAISSPSLPARPDSREPQPPEVPDDRRRVACWPWRSTLSGRLRSPY